MSETRDHEMPGQSKSIWKPLGPWQVTEFVPVGYVQMPASSPTSSGCTEHFARQYPNPQVTVLEDHVALSTTDFHAVNSTESAGSCASLNTFFSETEKRDYPSAFFVDKREGGKTCDFETAAFKPFFSKSDNRGGEMFQDKDRYCEPDEMECASATGKYDTGGRVLKESNEEILKPACSVNSPENKHGIGPFQADASCSEPSETCSQKDVKGTGLAENLSSSGDHKTGLHCDAEPGKNLQRKPASKRGHSKHNYVCPTCGGGFKNELILKRHIYRVHEREKLFKCPKCARSFKDNYSLNRHTNRKACDKTFTCLICDMTFGHTRLLHNHIVTTHTEEKPFVCQKCDKRYGRRDHLIRHMRKTHGKDGPP
ncbi:hypothetical protein BaRGS_00000603 [Batillaria attramentaria]|uniref:C2H2-type domain-containing protein n=1 Tax=Batillaria attramentaria TaxID=370345 RepID=A0ABD0M961_9CAEN